MRRIPSRDERTDTVVVGPSPSPTTTPTSKRPGAAIGRYLLIDEVGAGGMGVVYRAYDPKLHREVALKCVRARSLTEVARQRLLAEARAMAQLAHPNVVAVYDVEDDGREVVIAMEFVEGLTLSRWLKQRPRSWRDIVKCACEAGRGLEAAHAAGLLHRDFKPANVLVGRDGRARVTDFGIALTDAGTSSAPSSDLPIDSPDSVRTPPTQTGRSSKSGRLTEENRVMGTPSFMAPEQFQAGAPLDPRVDQYAFCVTLWKALTGKYPFPRSRIGGSPSSWIAAKSAGPPPWPRESDVPTPVSAAIVRGLAPERDDRWPSMNELLQALSYDPEVRRRRSMRLAGVAMVCAGTAGAVSLLSTPDTDVCTGSERALADVWSEPRRREIADAFAETHLPYADEVWQLTQERTTEFARAWVQMHHDACEATSVRGEQSSTVLDLRMGCLHRAKLRLTAVVDLYRDAASDPAVVERALELAAGLPDLEACADTAALTQEAPLPADHEAAKRIEAARDRLPRVEALYDAGRYTDALTALQEVEDDVAGVHYDPLRTELARRRGAIEMSLGHYEDAEASLDEALRLGLASGQFVEALGAAQQLLHLVGVIEREPERADAYVEVALGLTARPEIEARTRAETHNNIGGLRFAQGAYERAEEQYRKALELDEQTFGPKHPTVALTRNNLAVVLKTRGRLADALREHQKVLDVRLSMLGGRHPSVAVSRNNLAAVLVEMNRYEEALPQLEAAIETWEDSIGPEHASVGKARGNLATVLHHLGRHEESRREYTRATAILEEALGPEHPSTVGTLCDSGLGLARQDHVDALALETLATCVAKRDATGAPATLRGDAYFTWGTVLWRTGQRSKAREALAMALELADGDDSRLEERLAWLRHHDIQLSAE